jgi:hypothetical protein
MEELMKLLEIYMTDFSRFQYRQARVFKLWRLGRSKQIYFKKENRTPNWKR